MLVPAANRQISDGYVSGEIASPKATGGAGTVFEYRVAGVAYSMLLRGRHMPVGPLLPVERVGLQQRVSGHVLDDIVLFAAPASSGVRMQVQVKSRIAVQGRDSEFVKLMGAAGQACQQHRREIDDGAMLLGLAAGGPREQASELREITEMARAQLEPGMLRAVLGVSRPRLRDRYDHVVAAVREGAGCAGDADAEALAHRILAALYVWQVDVGPDGHDTRTALNWLSGITPPGVNAADVFAHLCDLAEDYAPRAGTADRDMLRRALRSRLGIRLGEQGAGAPARPGITRVCQLPPVTPDFRGRGEELETLRSLAEAGGGARPGWRRARGGHRREARRGQDDARRAGSRRAARAVR